MNNLFGNEKIRRGEKMEVMANITANRDPTEAPEAPREGTRIKSDNWGKSGMLLFGKQC